MRWFPRSARTLPLGHWDTLGYNHIKWNHKSSSPITIIAFIIPISFLLYCILFLFLISVCSVCSFLSLRTKKSLFFVLVLDYFDVLDVFIDASLFRISYFVYPSGPSIVSVKEKRSKKKKEGKEREGDRERKNIGWTDGKIRRTKTVLYGGKLTPNPDLRMFWFIFQASA